MASTALAMASTPGAGSMEWAKCIVYNDSQDASLGLYHRLLQLPHGTPAMAESGRSALSAPLTSGDAA